MEGLYDLRVYQVFYRGKVIVQGIVTIHIFMHIGSQTQELFTESAGADGHVFVYNLVHGSSFSINRNVGYVYTESSVKIPLGQRKVRRTPAADVGMSCRFRTTSPSSNSQTLIQGKGSGLPSYIENSSHTHTRTRTHKLSHTRVPRNTSTRITPVSEGGLLKRDLYFRRKVKDDKTPKIKTIQEHHILFSSLSMSRQTRLVYYGLDLINTHKSCYLVILQIHTSDGNVVLVISISQ